MKLEYVLTDIQELSFKKNLKENTQLNIQTKYNYSVFYPDDGSRCIGVLSVELSPPGDEDKLLVRYQSSSVFNLKDAALNDAVKKELHAETYNWIFPLCHSYIKNFLAMIGLPDIPIKPINYSDSNIELR